MVGSSRANLFASCAGGVCALWGPLHGGANVAVHRACSKRIHAGQTDARGVHQAGQGQGQRRPAAWASATASTRTTIRGPRSSRQACDEGLLAKLGIDDPLLDIARKLEEIALAGSLFRRPQALPERRLLQRHHPAGDRHSRPTCSRSCFAIGRLPGWIAQWKEQNKTPATASPARGRSTSAPRRRTTSRWSSGAEP